MRIGIVNDVPLVSEGLRRVLMRHTEFDVAWLACDGQEAVDKSGMDLPDVILMDLIMPVMDGVEATRQIMQNNPCPILIVTASVDENIAMVFDAMSHGALDVVTTPLACTGDPDLGTDEFLTKIKLVHAAAMATTTQLTSKRAQSASMDACMEATGLVAIGASSGGPQAILNVLNRMSRNLPVAIVVVQHMDEKFVPSFIEWLRQQLGRPVQRAVEGSKLCQGRIYVAVTSDHLVLNQDRHLAYTTLPLDYPYRPSVDIWLNSVVENWKRPACGVLLTGMGSDGATGLRNMRENGYYTITQDRQTSTVYGMPGAARALDAAIEELPLEQIGPAVERYMAARVR
ncbi:MAG: chemotaxis-specific protein-glutamate methyltransferase CheB [Gammaproteobacteria bacterium]|nr:chemotaxis-specific protein-glutamate methyltransferase CheB [Gammaproteobacteria bacterium]